MAGLKVSIQEIIEHNREEEWRRAGVTAADIELSRQTGIDGRDVRALREFSSRRMLIVVRCPRTTARAHHGIFPPKPLSTKDKTGTSGLVVSKSGRIFVSDYDLMSVWRLTAKGPEKVFISAAGGAVKGPWTPEAMAIVVSLNELLVSRLQHGCQDDFDNPSNRGVKQDDQFAAFYDGVAQFLASPAECADFYAKNGLAWPYDRDGKYVGSKT